MCFFSPCLLYIHYLFFVSTLSTFILRRLTFDKEYNLIYIFLSLTLSYNCTKYSVTLFLKEIMLIIKYMSINYEF